MKGQAKKTWSLVFVLGCVSCLAAMAEEGGGYHVDALHYVDLSMNLKETASDPIKTVSVEVQPPEQAGATVVKVFPDSIVQAALTGIGGAFNEQGGEAFMRLPAAKRKDLTQALFNPEKGAGLTFCRTAIGSSDFGLGPYSYSETANDYRMERFSVERDAESVIPFILAAKKENPRLRIFASPWSPPGWMKENGRMATTDAAPSRSRNPRDKDNVLRSDPKIYDAYALYFSKYVQGYAEHGVTIDRILVQNETDMNQSYPSCNMSPKQMSELIVNHIHPRFEKDGLKTEIWAGTFRARPRGRNDAAAFMKLKGRKFIDGIGFQYAMPQIVETQDEQYPRMPLMHTEGKCNNGRNTMAQARARFAEVADWLYSGVENYCYWNMVLNETSRSAWGWRQNSLVKVDRGTGTITYNNDFAPIALLSRFIRPGDQLLQVDAGNQKALAVKNEKRIVVFLQNNGAKPVARNIDIDGETASVELPANSLCAIVFK